MIRKVRQSCGSSAYIQRCAERNKITDKSCYEANIFDQRSDPTYGTGDIVHRGPVSPMPKAGGKWNVYEISELTVKLNGVATSKIQQHRAPGRGTARPAVRQSSPEWRAGRRHQVAQVRIREI